MKENKYEKKVNLVKDMVKGFRYDSVIEIEAFCKKVIEDRKRALNNLFN